MIKRVDVNSVEHIFGDLDKVSLCGLDERHCLNIQSTEIMSSKCQICSSHVSVVAAKEQEHLPKRFIFAIVYYFNDNQNVIAFLRKFVVATDIVEAICIFKKLCAKYAISNPVIESVTCKSELFE